MVALLASRCLTFLVCVVFASSFRLSPPTRIARRGLVFESHFEMSENSDSSVALNAVKFFSIIGASEMAYLTWAKLSSQPLAFCTGEATCGDVLSGPYASIPYLNIPIVALGFVAYGAVAASTNIPKESLQQWQRNFILFATTGMATFSGYLMLLLYFVLQKSCNFCYLSAILSCAMATSVWGGKLVKNQTQAFTIATSSIAITTLSSAFLFYVTSSLLVSEAVQASTAPAAQYLAMEEKEYDNRPPTVTKVSTPEAMKLAEKLRNVDAKMYGAYWCSHCFNQKQELGIQAKEYYTYIECDKKGYNSQNSMCRSKKIPGYPTWEIRGEFFPGEKTIEELDAIVPNI